MSQTTPTLIRTKLREALVYSLEQITEANSYWVTLRRVYDPPKNMDEMTEFPTVNLLIGKEERMNDRLLGNNSLLDLKWTVRIDVFLSESNNPPAEIDRVVASVQKYFGHNYYIPGSDGNRTAFNCIYLSSEPFGTELSEPNCGVSIELETFYRIQLTNPEAMF